MERKILWVGLVVVVVAPLVGLAWTLVAGWIAMKFHFRAVSPELLIFVPLPPLLFVAVFGVARKGLQRGWYQQTDILVGWTIASLGVVTLVLFVIQFFTSVRQSSQDMPAIGNARQLAAAADQYFLENGTQSAAFSQLVGATNYVKTIAPVAGEQYPAYFTQGVTITVTGIAGARTITYAP